MYAERLKEIRKQLRYTAQEMSDLLGIKLRTYGSYERGEAMPPLELCTIICEKFKINGNWFLTGEGEMFITAQPSTQDKTELVQTVKDTIKELFIQYGLDDMAKKISE